MVEDGIDELRERISVLSITRDRQDTLSLILAAIRVAKDLGDHS